MPRPRGGNWRKGTVIVFPWVRSAVCLGNTRARINSHGNKCWFLSCLLSGALASNSNSKGRKRKSLIVPRLHAMLRFGVGLNRGRAVFKPSITQLLDSHHCRAVVFSSSSSVFLDCSSRTSSRFLREFGARRTWNFEPYRCSKFYEKTLNSTLQISRYECCRDLSWHKMILGVALSVYPLVKNLKWSFGWIFFWFRIFRCEYVGANFPGNKFFVIEMCC